MGIKSYRPIRDWAVSAEQEARKIHTWHTGTPAAKKPSLRHAGQIGPKFPTDGTNRYLKAKRKQRITLAKISAMDDEP